LAQNDKFEQMQRRSFVPARLRELRIACGLTPDALGELTDLGGARITALEHQVGPLVPSERATLAHALQVDSEVLGLPVPSRPQSTGPVFVCAALRPDRIIVEEADIWLRYLAQLYGAVSTPFASNKGQSVYVPLIDNKLDQPFDAGDPSYLDQAGIETFAARLREQLAIPLGLPVAGVVGFIERAGALIGMAPFANKQYGAAAWINNRPVIVLNSHLRAVQSRFVALWALFHLMLHRSVSVYDLDDVKRYEQFSQQARNAALAFLAPADTFRPELRRIIGTGRWRALCERWGLTERNILQRAGALGIWTPELAADLEAARQTFHTETKPESPTDYPVFLKKTVMKLYDQMQILPQEMADRVGITVAQVAALASLAPTHKSIEAPVIRRDNIVSLRRA
jgi:Zn-dependent peptidase ImmA (M78 family)